MLHPKGAFRLTGQWQLTSRHGLTRLGGAWTVIELWTLSAEDLLALNDVGIVPWVPLTQSNLPPEDLLRHCRERIELQARPEEQANLLAVTQVMTSVRYNEVALLSILGGRAMIAVESPLIKELLYERSRDELQAVLQKILRAKFPAAPAEVLAKVQAIQNLERLSELSIHASICSDLDSFRARLAE